MDDMLIVESSIRVVNMLKQQSSKEFEMKDLKAANQIFEMRIMQDTSEGILKLCMY